MEMNLLMDILEQMNKYTYLFAFFLSSRWTWNVVRVTWQQGTGNSRNKLMSNSQWEFPAF